MTIGLDVDRVPVRHELAHRAVTDAGGRPVCSSCRRRLGYADVWRCPYARCRVWLRAQDGWPREIITPARP